MAKTLGFSVSSSKFRSSANFSEITYLSSLSTCPTLNGLRLTVNWAVKPGINVAGQFFSYSEKVMCRSSLNPRDFSSEALESSTKVEEISWGSGATTLEARVDCENVKQVFRSDNAPVASSDDASASIRKQLESAIAVEGLKELMNSSVSADANLAKTHVERAWDHWNKLGAPRLIVAPMMDQSELPFRMLCRKYGATAGYTQMFHSRPFALQPGYRRVEFSTCPKDRPLLVQFGGNDPEILLKAAMIVQEHCDYVDINLGCPQRVAKRGNYGAFLMDDLPLIQSMVTHLAANLTTPVSCKIRVFPDLKDTLAYARMLEDAGCSLLAVHGRTREQKDGRASRADWEAIKAVKEAVGIPVLANGNIRWLEDVHECIRMTGVEGVMSAESLLENPALFGGHRMKPVEHVTGSLDELSREGALNEPSLTLEYLALCEKYPVTKKMIRAHVYKLLVGWFKRYPELRDELNIEQGASIGWIRDLVYRLLERHISSMANGSSRETVTQGVSVETSRLAQTGS